jgi:serine/threonine-protein kinase
MWGEVTRTLARGVVSVRLSPSEDRGFIGRFEVRGLLGRGGMGVVYDVTDTETGAQLALKMIAVRFLQLEDGRAASRFAHEIRVLERLDHPGIVKLYEYGLAETPDGEHLAFFVMERLVGRTIGQAIAKHERFDPLEGLRTAASVSDALAYLDASSVQHRDIKPGNVFLEAAGRTVLMDFGLARSDHFTKLTRAGHIVGTIFYMSPERLRGQDADIRSDVYALGIVLFEMLTGGRPHTEDDPNALVRSIRRGIVWPGGFDRTPAHRAVRELIDQMTAFDAAVRPSPAEVAARAAAALDPGRPPIAVSRPPDAGAPPPVSMLPMPVRAGPTWTASLLMTIVFSLFTFLAGLVIGTRRPPPPAIAVAPPPPPPKDAVVVEPREKLEFASAEAAFRYGDEQLKAKRHAESIQALEQALAMNPAYADAYRRLGDAHLSAGHLEKARSAYEKYKKLRPDAPDAEAIEQLLESFER